MYSFERHANRDLPYKLVQCPNAHSRLCRAKANETVSFSLLLIPLALARSLTHSRSLPASHVSGRGPSTWAFALHFCRYISSDQDLKQQGLDMDFQCPKWQLTMLCHSAGPKSRLSFLFPFTNHLITYCDNCFGG